MLICTYSVAVATCPLLATEAILKAEDFMLKASKVLGKLKWAGPLLMVEKLHSYTDVLHPQPRFPRLSHRESEHL